MADTYRLRVQITVERHQQGAGYTGERLSVSEDRDIDVPTFLEAARILGEFHQLAETIQAKP